MIVFIYELDDQDSIDDNSNGTFLDESPSFDVSP